VTAAILLVLGAAFMLLAGVGLVRLPDVFLRLSATSKAATLGAALTLLGAAVHFGDFAVTGRAVAVVSFLFLTAPVAAHKIGRAGYRRGSALYEGTICDEAKDGLRRDDDVAEPPPARPGD
jgi:multicomponent Na+:H+ antiporter subunit G